MFQHFTRRIQDNIAPPPPLHFFSADAHGFDDGLYADDGFIAELPVSYRTENLGNSYYRMENHGICHFSQTRKIAELASVKREFSVDLKLCNLKIGVYWKPLNILAWCFAHLTSERTATLPPDSMPYLDVPYLTTGRKQVFISDFGQKPYSVGGGKNISWGYYPLEFIPCSLSKIC